MHGDGRRRRLVRLGLADHRGGRDDADGKQKMLAAGPRNTVRSRSRTGKPTRQLQSAWTDAWYAPDAPDPLPMPLQGVLSRPPMDKIDRLAAGGHAGAAALATYYVARPSA